jgi:hypothetical protein
MISFQGLINPPQPSSLHCAPSRSAAASWTTASTSSLPHIRSPVLPSRWRDRATRCWLGRRMSAIGNRLSTGGRTRTPLRNGFTTEMYVFISWMIPSEYVLYVKDMNQSSCDSRSSRVEGTAQACMSYLGSRSVCRHCFTFRLPPAWTARRPLLRLTTH